MLDAPVVRLKRRPCGEPRVIALSADGGLLVRFTVPFPVQELEIEAAASATRAVLIKSPVVAARYGLASAMLSPEQAGATAMRVHLVEAALVLWTHWTVNLNGGDAPEPITAEAVSEVLTDPVANSLWSQHYFAALSLERDEGNVSAASPSTTSGEAATTAEAAPNSTSPAAEASPPAPDASAPRSRTSRRRRKASSSAGSDQPPGS